MTTIDPENKNNSKEHQNDGSDNTNESNKLIKPSGWLYNHWIRFLTLIDRHHDAYEVLLTAIAIVVATLLLWKTSDQVDEAQKARFHADSLFSYQRIQDSLNSIHQYQRDTNSDSVTARNLRLAQQSLEATKRSVDIAERNAVAELRPYVYPTMITIMNLKVGRIPAVIRTSKNFGKTPGYNVQLVSDSKIGHDIYEKEWPIHNTSDTLGYALAPDLPTVDTCRFFRVWTAEDSVYISQPGHHFLFMSTIFYRDQFHNAYFTQQGFVYTVGDAQLGELRKHTKIK
jgi:hypothetical protein